jgi:AbrB family looped-hinge helix DNA binding protein
MATTSRAMKTEQAAKKRPIVSTITDKFQITVPQEVREWFGLLKGDMLEWSLDAAQPLLIVAPKRAQLLTPKIVREIEREQKAPQAALI